ncbi:hypothetical protein V6N13_065443 [Hibiscus sabdariffa]
MHGHANKAGVISDVIVASSLIDACKFFSELQAYELRYNLAELYDHRVEYGQKLFANGHGEMRFEADASLGLSVFRGCVAHGDRRWQSRLLSWIRETPVLMYNYQAYLQPPVNGNISHC